jgi:septal ring factor EnvC (AmiA/AmiB activator)
LKLGLSLAILENDMKQMQKNLEEKSWELKNVKKKCENLEKTIVKIERNIDASNHENANDKTSHLSQNKVLNHKEVKTQISPKRRGYCVSNIKSSSVCVSEIRHPVRCGKILVLSLATIAPLLINC